MFSSKFQGASLLFLSLFRTQKKKKKSYFSRKCLCFLPLFFQDLYFVSLLLLFLFFDARKKKKKDSRWQRGILKHEKSTGFCVQILVLVEIGMLLSRLMLIRRSISFLFFLWEEKDRGPQMLWVLVSTIVAVDFTLTFLFLHHRRQFVHPKKANRKSPEDDCHQRTAGGSTMLFRHKSTNAPHIQCHHKCGKNQIRNRRLLNKG